MEAEHGDHVRGDTDYEELIYGTHKTVIIKGLVKLVSENAFLRSTGLRDDIVPLESLYIGILKVDSPANEIANILKQLSKASA